ncbi:hypothetical protein DX933_17030 [Ornithinibacillus gellani]|uniref:hypothetical protein n=1 Tax=Ornithinibacillus gellani TaxID=2293253 RepID=UPI000F4844E5|nr:hypothetical protein [Ornithinibacillus gellani]TQS71063.1 hypothetical protein DX933_17030 [Ornithinibacillus gellani]
MKKIIAVVAVVLVFGGIMLYFSGEGKRNIKQAMAVGEKYKQAVYTMKYADIPQNMAEWDPFLEKRAEKFATRDELDEQMLIMRQHGLQLALVHEVDVELVDIAFELLDLPDNTKDKLNFQYTMDIALKHGEETVTEISVDGRMRIEKVDSGWKVAWSKDDLPTESSL